MTTHKITAVDGGVFTFTGHLVLDDDFVSVVDLDEDEVVFAIPTYRVSSVERVKEASDLVIDLGKDLLGSLLNRKDLLGSLLNRKD